MLTQKQVEAAIRTRVPGKTPKLFDGQGLYLELPPSGSARWRLKYRHAGREKRISLGVWPDVGLKDARTARDNARRLLQQGIDPSAHRKATRAAEADTFEAVAWEWFAKQSPTWAPSTKANKRLRLEKHILPRLGRVPVASVGAPEVLAALRPLDEKGQGATVKKTRQIIGEVMRYAIATGRPGTRDPTGDIRGALKPHKTTHHAAITDPVKFGALLRAIDGYDGQPSTSLALRLAPLVFLRPGELRQAEWAEIDLDAATWVIPAAKMKMNRDHVVPLSSQAVAILREAEALSRGGRYVFPSVRTRERPISDNTLNAALRRLGYSHDEMTVHGFRASARTLLAEVLGEREDLLEHQLAHEVKGPLGRAYNRAQFLDERRAMMQRWVDYLDALKVGAAVIPLHGARQALLGRRSQEAGRSRSC